MTPPPTSPGAALWAALQKIPRTLRRQTQYYVEHLLDGDHQWGNSRETLMWVLILLFMLVGRVFEPVQPPTWVELLVRATPVAATLPANVFHLVHEMGAFVSLQTLRHVLPPILGTLWALRVGASFLRDVLELPSLEQAQQHLTATFFGRDYPHMRIENGQASVSDEDNPMLKVGGPGWVDIKLGTAALFERVAGPSAVLGAGTHFVRRFETLREAFDLREVEMALPNVKAMTKDGVPLLLPEISARLRLRAREMRSEANPYPVSVGAVRRAVYSRKVKADGVEPWSEMVMSTVRTTIVGWIARKRMDELIAPPASSETPAPAQAPYRRELHQLFQQAETRKKFYDMGAEVVRLSVGHLRPHPDADPDARPEADVTGHDKIQQQLVETWKAGQAALAQDQLSDVKAYSRWLADTARAQAQADMILSLTNGLHEAHAKGLPMAQEITNRLLEYATGVQLRPAPEAEVLRRMMLISRMLEVTGNPAQNIDLLTGE